MRRVRDGAQGPRDSGSADDSQYTETYRFGNCELRLQTRELLRDGEPAALEPRAFDLLEFLLKHRERVVSKDELREALWPGTYVSEGSLSRCVMKARRAVGDDAGSQNAIKTVHGRGYRFIADVRDPMRVPNRGSTPEPPIEDRQWRRALRFPALLASAALVSLVLAALSGIRSGDEPRAAVAGIPRVAVLPIENQTGDAGLAWVELGLMDTLIGQLQRQSRLSVTASDEIITTLQPADDTESDIAATPEAARQLLEQLGATHLVRAVLKRPGQAYRLEATVTSYEGGISDIELVSGDPLNLIAEFRRQIDERIAGPRHTGIAPRIVSDDMFVNEAYARGRDQLLRGNLAQAQTLLQVAVDEEPDNFWARYGLATAALDRGDAGLAAEMQRTLLEEARLSGCKLEEASSLFLLGRVHLLLDDYPRAESLYREALAGFEALDMHIEQVEVLNGLAIIAGKRQSHTEKRALLEQAVQAFRHSGLEETPADLLHWFGHNAFDRGEMEEAQQYFEMSLAAYREQGMKRKEALLLYTLSRVAQFQGDFTAALALAEQSLDIASNAGYRWVEAVSLRRTGSVALARGDLGRAADAFNASLELVREMGAEVDVAFILTALSDVDRLNRLHEEAERRLSEAARLLAGTEDSVVGARIELRSGRLALDRGDLDWALMHADRVIAGEAKLRPALVADGYFLRGVALAAAGDLDRGEKALEDAYTFSVVSGDRVRRARIAVALGLLNVDRQRPDLAAGYLGVARDAVPGTHEHLILSSAIAAEEGDWDTAAAQLDAARRRAGGLWTDGDEQRMIEILASAPTNLEASLNDPNQTSTRVR